MTLVCVLAAGLGFAMVRSATAAVGPHWSIRSIAEPSKLLLPENEVQTVAVRATGGTFTLGWGGVKTSALAYNATSEAVAGALNGLTTIGDVGGSVTVTGGPGDETADSPYKVTFGGTLSGRALMSLTSASALLTGGQKRATVTETTKGGSPDEYTVTAVNSGGTATDGSIVRLTEDLPVGVSVDEAGATGVEELFEHPMTCETNPTSATCTVEGPIVPGDALVMTIKVDLAPDAPASMNRDIARVAGGGLGEARTSAEAVMNSTQPDFGFPDGSALMALSNTQAGAHPDVTTNIAFNTGYDPFVVAGMGLFPFIPVGSPKDVDVALPSGLLGDPLAVAQCQPGELHGDLRGGCPAASQVGLVELNLGGAEFLPRVFPVYNMAPQPGQPAELGFFPFVAPVYIPVQVRSDGDYGVNADLSNVTQALPLVSSTLTLWGVPSDPIHDAARWNPATFEFGASSGNRHEAFLSNPTSCSGTALTTALSADSWQAPGVFASATAEAGEITGCDQLSFTPSMHVYPDTAQAGAPAGYTVELEVPQSDDPASLATPTLKNANVTLPAGTFIAPGVADGLQACSSDPSSAAGDQFALHKTTPAECPPASQIGTVQVESPDLSSSLEGQVFLGQPDCGVCNPTDAQEGRMVKIFLQAQGSGVIVKLEGHGSINQATGRLTTTFSENPQLPFKDLKLTLKGGPRAPLANPTVCGPATTTTDLTPWSAPFTPDATPSSSFEVTGCGGSQFAPTFAAGTTNNQAARFSPLSVTFTRSDRDQDLGAISMQMPPGLLGMLSQVPLCPEPQASQGTCGAASLIGHTTAGIGPGSNPYYLGGSVYLTGPYKGAPFGLSIVVPAKAGPFTLAGTTGTGLVVVRAAIAVNPNTAAVTIASDPLPQALDGIPLHVKLVNVTVDRLGFIFNPTNCSAQAITGVLTGAQGASAPLSAHFQAANCATLPFKPKFSASTQAKSSRKNGASLDVKVGYPKGTQANIRSVKVLLPKQLPSRLTTIQKACLETTFAANPATCPAGSDIGTAIATTPVLGVPLIGPAYLVSHGGAAFPDLVVILQGEGVTVDLTGSINISKKSITSSTFGSVPDVPISSFELKLPEGPHSALTSSLPAKAKGNLCASKLTMPTTITGQNGARIEQSTKITVSGCPKVKKKAKRKKK